MRVRTVGVLLGVAALGTVAARRASARPGLEFTTPEGEPAGDLTGAPGGLTSRARSAPGVRGAARVAPPDWEPAVLTRLAGWVPAPPATAAGRLLAYLWASPMTLAGLVAGVAAGVPPRVHDGALLFAGARGLPRWFFGRRGYAAFALGHVIVARDPEPSGALLRHELVHVRQAERLGPAMAGLYLKLHAVYGYARHPMERAARAAQRRDLGVPERR
jgi:hypothetical protein